MRLCGKYRERRRKHSYLYLEELQSKSVNMFTTVFVGNSRTRIQDGKLITPRGYKIEQ